jgi:hypothetical protein
MEQIIKLVTGITGLIVTITAFVSAVSLLLRALRELLERRKKGMKKVKTGEKVSWIIGILFLVISGSILTLNAIGSPEPKVSLNEALTTAAWDAYNDKDYGKAIAKAQECVDEFKASADREQAKLENEGVPLPPTGKVSDAEWHVIIERGLLNDVATCYFIIGRSAEHLGQIDVARGAYGHAMKYTYARTWDPAGFFWSPAEAAGDRLSNLR